jgi:hypothetical protein
MTKCSINLNNEQPLAQALSLCRGVFAVRGA